MTVVNAKDTEDVTGAGFLGLGKGVDEFYTIGGVAIAPETTNVGVRADFTTGIVKATEGETYYPYQKVFDAVIAPNSRFVVEYTGMDEDTGKDVKTWSAITGAAGIGTAAVALGACAGTVVCGIATAAFAAVGAVLSLDQDDKLGVGHFDVGTLRQNQYGSYTYQTHLGDCGGFQSSCDYDITHTVTVVPTNDPLTPLH